MPGIRDVSSTFQEFAQHIRDNRSDAINCIANLDNGFEGWLKLEMYFWLVRTKHLHPCEDSGLEYKATLDRRYAEMDRVTKQCDLWIRDSERTDAFHYIEIKTPFANTNRGKVLRSLAYDFWYMSRIRASYEQAASGNAIVLGVGFDDEEWRRGLEGVRYHAGLPEDAEAVGEGQIDSDGRIRWQVLTKRYGLV